MGVKDAAFTSSVQRFISEGARSGSHSAAADVFRCTPAAPLLSAVRNNDALFHAEKNTYRKPLFPLEVRRTERRISLCLSPCAPQESGCSGALGNWRPQSRRESFYRLKEEGGGEKRKEKKKSRRRSKARPQNNPLPCGSRPPRSPSQRSGSSFTQRCIAISEAPRGWYGNKERAQRGAG